MVLCMNLLRFFCASVVRHHLQDVPADVHLAGVPTEIWANVNRGGHRNTIHNHGQPTESVVASCVYYPHTEDAYSGGAKLRLFLPDGIEEIAPEPGTLLLFPTNLLHETEFVAVDGKTRISMAFNLRVRWLSTPLLRAAAIGDVACISSLANEGADLEQKDAVLGLRAMHVAAEAGHLAAVQKLVDLGADIYAVSSEGSSPVGLAWDRGHTSVEKYLEQIASKAGRLDEVKVLPPARKASPEFPGVDIDRADIIAAFESAGLTHPSKTMTGSSFQALAAISVAAAFLLIAFVAFAIIGEPAAPDMSAMGDVDY